MARVLALALGFTLASAALTPLADALCTLSPLVGPAPTPSYQLVSAVIDSFEYANTARERTEVAGRTLQRVEEKAGGREHFVNDLSAFLLAVKQSGEDYRCAASLLHAFDTSAQDNLVRDTARLASLAYITLAEVEAEMVNSLIRDLDARTPLPLGQQLNESAGLELRKEQAWKALLPVALGLSQILAQPPRRQGERVAWPHIRASERDALRARLQHIFGPSVRQGFKAGQAALEFAAAAVDQTLADPRLPISHAQ